METTEKLVRVLNDLIEVNNNRIAGFERVLADIKDENADLKILFHDYTMKSRKYNEEITALVADYSTEVETVGN